MTDRVEEVGRVFVDSGQLIICDPCYIDGPSGWGKEEMQDIRIYQDVDTNKRYTYREDFADFESIMPDALTKHGIASKATPNALIKSGEWKRLPNTPNHNFSYAGACHQTLEHGHGILHFMDATHIPDGEGCAAVSETHHGDGVFPVKVHYRKGEDRPYKMEVIFG
jgi:hypothetical protein